LNLLTTNDFQPQVSYIYYIGVLYETRVFQQIAVSN